MKAAALLGIYPNSPGLVLMRDTGRFQVYSYPFQSIDFGGISIKGPRILISSEGFIPGPATDLILGMDTLRQIRFTIAYGERRLFISAPHAN
jgi:hypothetical protein